MLEVLSLPLLVECSFEDSRVGPESETRRSIVSSVNDILGVSSLVQWETVLPRFVDVPLSGTDKPADAAL